MTQDDEARRPLRAAGDAEQRAHMLRFQLLLV
jgi:hypothetical protein